ncbi:MAG: DUF4337 domain-containing protein [Acidobacteriaceae bacterium]|nr:DUF4337 domain-containing protein [Acidobacteriaceae bacterium]
MPEHEEVEEHVQHAQDPFNKTVAGTMAIIAALLAIVSVLGQHFNTEKLLDQQLASDEWAYYQAKDIRRYVAQVAQDGFNQIKTDNQISNKYAHDSDRYKTQSAEIEDKARDFEKERDSAGRRGDRFHFGEVFLEVAIVLSSLAILTKRRALFLGGVGSALVGVVIAFTAYWP